MCVDPVTAVAIGSTAVGVVSDIVDNRSEAQVARENEEAVQQSLDAALRDIGARGREEIQSAVQRREIGRRSAQRAAATARVAAGEAGVGGQSLDLLLGDIDRQFGDLSVSIDQNTDATLDQLDRERVSTVVQAENQRRGVQSPSFLNTGLRIAGRGLGLASTLIGRQPALG